MKKLDDLKFTNSVTFQSMQLVDGSTGHIFSNIFGKIFDTLLATLQYTSSGNPAF